MTMGRLEFATPRAAWGGEATHFTPLLGQAEMLEYLGDTTGIGPMIAVEVEHATANNRSLDILAETADGRRIAIENQYGVADHDHLTRGLAYAVATNSSGLVVIAEDHRDEFLSVAAYLNDVAGQATTHGIRVWLVQVRAVRRIGDDVWSPEFVVQAEPNEWENAVRRDATPILPSLDDFYEKCAELTGREWAETARTIIHEWLDRPSATESHGNVNTVSLYYPTPTSRGRTNVVQLSTNGALTICRGFVWETSGVFDPSEAPLELDNQIRSHFPAAVWTGKQYFLKVPDPQPLTVSSFLDWLTGRFEEAAVSDLEPEAALTGR